MPSPRQYARACSLLFAVGAAALASSCNSTPAPLLSLDAACTDDGQCGSGMCRSGKCTRTCAAQGDCPTGFDCGLQQPADGQSGGVGATCYKSTFDTTPAAMGGFGADCSVYAPDPASGDACDNSASNPCAAGYTCLSSLKCDPLAYCSKGCSADVDCPPTMFCATPAHRAKCSSDSDCTVAGDKCVAPPGGDGSFKVCLGASFCQKRTQCSACGTDDQCPVGYACATDAGGGRFCGKTCDPTAVSDGYFQDCPLPQGYGMGNPMSNPFFGCVAAGGSSTANVCRPTAGYCSGPSALSALASQNGTICSPCRVGVPGDCPNSYCQRDEFSGEAFCTTPCTARATRSQGAYNITNDTCPSGSTCYAQITCTTSCQVSGICGGDTNPGVAGEVLTTYFALTCYPLSQ